MSYILPIPQFQYNDYRERVINETSDGYSYADAVSKVSFDKILQDRPEPQMTSEEQRRKRESEHEAFRVHMAQMSGRGVEINKLA